MSLWTQHDRDALLSAFNASYELATDLLVALNRMQSEVATAENLHPDSASALRAAQCAMLKTIGDAMPVNFGEMQPFYDSMAKETRTSMGNMGLIMEAINDA